MGACRLYVVPKLTLHFTMYDEALLELLALSAAARAQHCWFTEVVEQTPLVWRDTPCCERAPWWASHNHCDGSRFFRRPHQRSQVVGLARRHLAWCGQAGRPRDRAGSADSPSMPKVRRGRTPGRVGVREYGFRVGVVCGVLKRRGWLVFCSE